GARFSGMRRSSRLASTEALMWIPSLPASVPRAQKGTRKPTRTLNLAATRIAPCSGGWIQLAGQVCCVLAPVQAADGCAGEDAGGGGDVGEVATCGYADVLLVDAPLVGRVVGQYCRDASSWVHRQRFDPRVWGAVAQQMPGDIAGGDGQRS